ncbi:ribbon-helix-helix domain-containing protein [Hoeflea ulvae]|uniref:Ribbon-helix-helix domain-containing protein n=1 Tax=Hoeflea ulvae TaxID=2983764 RepID=A0ABT3YEP4_9HYPH|nr:ribbon-helix-helix domain-containing protein [Hoeflea ulvae]MCY0094348.1 ribbon-helix-helix domain-containing protein [Hoeflea ulvae]
MAPPEPGGQIRKHSVSIRGHRTSITLEDAFMDGLRRMADERDMALAALIAEIDSAHDGPVNLSSAIRVAVLDWALGRAAQPATARDAD